VEHLRSEDGRHDTTHDAAHGVGQGITQGPTRNDASSRRAFVAAIAALGLGTLPAFSFAQNGLTPPPAPGTSFPNGGVPSDGAVQFAALPGRNINEKVLNFALTLELLEADLYRQALNLASGRAKNTPLNNDRNAYRLKVPSGGLSPGARDAAFRYLVDFSLVEVAHREFLIGALWMGGAPIAKANPRGYKFPTALPANLAGILAAILPLEETGVRAYLGALPYLTDLMLAQTAGTIFSTEARHSAAIAYVLNVDPGPRPSNGDLKVAPAYPAQNTFEYFLKPTTVLTAASAYFA